MVDLSGRDCFILFMLLAGCDGGSPTKSDAAGDASIPPRSIYVQVDVGNATTCALGLDGVVFCTNQLAPPPAKRFTAITVGELFGCGLTTERTISCWGANDGGQANPPAGTFSQVKAGDGFACGLRANGSVQCWGDSKYRVLDVPAESFEEIGAGAYHACAITAAGDVKCWGGVNAFGAPIPPPGAAAHVDAGSKVSCALLRDGTIACTGLAPPDGTFTQLSVGYTHACALRDDGTTVCWGDDNNGQATPPIGTFASVSAGFESTCGVRLDGTSLCWGTSGQHLTSVFSAR